MDVLQGRPWKIFVNMKDISGDPVTGILSAEVVLRYMRQNDAVMQSKTPASTDWVETTTPGVYSVLLSSDDTSQLGGLYVSAEAPTCRPFTQVFSVLPNSVASVQPGKCLIVGNIVDIGGNPERNVSVRFRIVKLPATVGNAVIGGDPIHTQPDAFGAFSALLIRGAVVLVEIPGAALKHQITVPDQETANLVDILPPINNN
jgi:hypothetical protein